MKIKQRNELREFNRLCKELESLYYEVAVNVGVSDSAFWIMYAIAVLGDGCLQKDISENYSISKQTISSSVRTLEKKGYITLKHGQGRNMHLLLTAEGRTFVHEKVAPLVELENSVYQEMSDEEGRELLRLSQKYNKIFKEKVAELLDRGN